MNSSQTTITLNGLGWVLPPGVGAGPQLPASTSGGTALTEFTPKTYITGVKGYLDPAAGYLLAACTLAMGEHRQTMTTPARRADAGICTVTRYGATDSAAKFYNLFLDKGPSLASPLVFPHGYANTAGNLAAIEYGFAGPHMVFTGATPVWEAWQFALARLRDATATDMLVGAYEAVAAGTVTDELPLVQGAIVAWLSRVPIAAPLATLPPEPLHNHSQPEPTSDALSQMRRLCAAVLQPTG